MSSSPTLTSLPPELLLLISSSLGRDDLQSLALTSRIVTKPAQEVLLETLEIKGEEIYSFIGTPFDFKDTRGLLGALEDRGRTGCVHHLSLLCVPSWTAEDIRGLDQGVANQHWVGDNVFESGSATPALNIFHLISRLPGLRELELELPCTTLTEELVALLRPNLENLAYLNLVIGKWDLQHTFLSTLVRCTPNLTTLGLSILASQGLKTAITPRPVLTNSLLPKLTHFILRSPHYLSVNLDSLFSSDLIPQITRLTIDLDSSVLQTSLPSLTKAEASFQEIFTIFGSTIQHLSLQYSAQDARRPLGKFSPGSLAPLINLQTIRLTDSKLDFFSLLKLPSSCTRILFDLEWDLVREEFQDFLHFEYADNDDSLRGRTLVLKSQYNRVTANLALWRACQQIGLNVEFTPLAKTSN